MKNTPFGIAGYSGSGKTTLIERLLPELIGRGLRVNVIKHSHHDLVLEPPSKDSARFRAAGAGEVLVASPYRFAIVQELRGAPEPSLDEQLARLAPADLVLVEGFKREPIPKIEVWRQVTQKPPLYPEDNSIIALAGDFPPGLTLPWLDLNSPASIATFIFEYLENHA